MRRPPARWKRRWRRSDVDEALKFWRSTPRSSTVTGTGCAQLLRHLSGPEGPFHTSCRRIERNIQRRGGPGAAAFAALRPQRIRPRRRPARPGRARGPGFSLVDRAAGGGPPAPRTRSAGRIEHQRSPFVRPAGRARARYLTTCATSPESGSIGIALPAGGEMPDVDFTDVNADTRKLETFRRSDSYSR